TNDIALRHFSKNSRSAGVSNHLTYEMRLRRGIAVIELHDIRGESLTAIAARHLAELIKQLCCARVRSRVYSIRADLPPLGQPQSCSAHCRHVRSAWQFAHT